MKIKEVADQLKVSLRAIRFYEEKGLITPAKQSENQYRVFTEIDLERLRTIMALREIGMPLDAIKKVLAELNEEKPAELLDFLDKQRSEMANQWVELKDMIDTTDEMINTARREKVLPLAEIHHLAEQLKIMKKRRRDWEDRWDFDDQASCYDEQVYKSVGNFNIHANYDEALGLTVEWVYPVRGEEGLDIGIGTGNLAGRFVGAGARMFGVDQSREMLNRCREKFPQIETKLGHFLALPYEDHRFDFVVTSYALHHLDDDQKELALQEMVRVLKPSGRICIADLMFEDQKDREKYLHHLKEQGRHDIVAAIEDEYFADRARLLGWFRSRGFSTKARKINEFLHVVDAKKI